MAPQGSLMAGRCHGGTGREESTPPTSPRNSHCDGLWVSASPDIIRRWDPDVQLSCGAFQTRVFSKVGRKRLFLFSLSLFLFKKKKMTGNELMEEIRGDEERGKRSAEHLSQLGTSPEDPCEGFPCSPSSSVLDSSFYWLQPSQINIYNKVRRSSPFLISSEVLIGISAQFECFVCSVFPPRNKVSNLVSLDR